MSKIKNDPGFDYERCSLTSREAPIRNNPSRPVISARKTEVLANPSPSLGQDKICPIHKSKHTLNTRRAFKAKPIEERRKLLKQKKNICFKCCESDRHMRSACKQDVRCIECGSASHPTALHIVKSEPTQTSDSSRPHGGEQSKRHENAPQYESVVTSCLQICGTELSGKSCAKNILGRVYPEGQPQNAQLMYAIVDDQSNRSLVKSDFFKLFGIDGENLAYKLSSCAGHTSTYGRRASGFIVEP